MFKSSIIYVFLDCGVFLIFRKWLEKPRIWKSKNYRIHQTSLIYVLLGRSVFFCFPGMARESSALEMQKSKNTKMLQNSHIFGHPRDHDHEIPSSRGPNSCVLLAILVSILIHRCSPSPFLCAMVRPGQFYI